MTRFIIASFAMLAWAFYELSGGVDYVPKVQAEPIFTPVVVRADTSNMSRDQRRLATPSTTVKTALAQTKRTPLTNTAPTTQIVHAALAVPDAAETQLFPLETATPTVTAAAAAPEPKAHANGFVEIAVAPKIEVATLSAPREEIDPTVTKDIRQVTGNRVNMRTGPGTSFSVVSKLQQGSDVEVLEDTGDGWLKLRVMESGRVGYMADWLVAAAVN
ncbi:MAG: SH3 domain-containing protein [Marinovum sp.]|nr:SH3 domain-containing protein [Marinovum sp.]